MKRIAVTLLLAGFVASRAGAQSANISVNAAVTGVPIGALHYGIFYEEINHAGNGGLWAELILNRSFENGNPLEGWTKLTTGGAAGDLTTDTNSQFNAYNKTELAVTVTSVGASGSCGVYNAGFFNSLPITAGKTYTCVIYARKASGFAGNLIVRLEDASGGASNTNTISNFGLTTNWTGFTFALTATRTVPAARLAITTQSTGTFYLTYVSLMPDDAEDGFRPDLLQKLKDLNPAFVRFPGGCYVEGTSLANAWQWKGGIGPHEGRRTHWNGVWGYWDNNGLGLYEYLILCEKLGAEPLFVANVGMSHSDTVTGAALQPFLQDALDAIQFANGDTNTTWGAQRAAMGHPTPFNLKLLEIGNENGGTIYNSNYLAFSTAIRSNYPSVYLVADGRGTPAGAPVNFVDEHYYPSADWFAQEAHHFDSYSRAGPKVYVGEYAVTTGAGLGNLSAALGEAMWMMGMERNADLVIMCSYAPLFVNVNNRAWNPDLICFDANASYGTPSYYVQKLMSANKGDINLVTVASGPEKPATLLNGGVGVGTWLTASEYADVTVSNDVTALYQSNFTNNTTGWTPDGGTWAVVDGNLRQSDAGRTDCRDVYYAPAWTDYTLTLKARKISGNEGFLILFRVKDHSNYYWWNVGGWGNVQSAVERAVGGGRVIASSTVPYNVQTNVWYDLKVVAQTNHIQCYIRPEAQPEYSLIHDFYDNPTFSGFDAMATSENNSGDILLKVVNRTANALINTPVIMTNTGWSSLKATVTTLTAGSDTAENSLANPTNVSPIVTQLAGLNSTFNYTFPAYSLTILRLSLNASNLVSITAGAGGGGSIAPQGSVLLPMGTNQTFTIIPSVNYVIANVLVDGVPQGAISSYTFTNVTTAHNIFANFALKTNETSAGLAHRYSFSETSGNIVNDTVGGPAWNGTLPNGGTFFNDQLAFAPGSQQYVSLPPGIVSASSNLTVMAWVNLNSTATWSRIFDFGDNTTRYMFLTPQTGGTMRFAITTNSNGAAEQQINCSTGVSIGAWHQIAVTLSSAKGVLYLDGLPVGTNSSMTLNPTTLGVTANNYIGKSQWPDPYLDGMMDEFRIYNRALGSDEIAATAALGANAMLSDSSPSISIEVTETNLTLSWPLATAGYALRSRTNLVAGDWMNVTSPTPQIVGGRWQIVIPSLGDFPSTFYRLAK